MSEPMPAALRLYLNAIANQIFGGGEPIAFSEADFSKEELAALHAAMQTATAAGRTSIQFGDYPTQRPPVNPEGHLESRASNIFEELDLIFTDPARSAMFAIGRANFADGVITDQYNFHAPPELEITPDVLVEVFKDLVVTKNPRGLFNFIGNAVGLRNNAGPEVRIDLNIPQEGLSTGR